MKTPEAISKTQICDKPQVEYASCCSARKMHAQGAAQLILHWAQDIKRLLGSLWKEVEVIPVLYFVKEQVGKLAASAALECYLAICFVVAGAHYCLC